MAISFISLDKCRWRESSVASSRLVRFVEKKDSRILQCQRTRTGWASLPLGAVRRCSLVLANSCEEKEKHLPTTAASATRKLSMMYNPLSVHHCYLCHRSRSSRCRVHAAEQLSITFTRSRGQTNAKLLSAVEISTIFDSFLHTNQAKGASMLESLAMTDYACSAFLIPARSMTPCGSRFQPTREKTFTCICTSMKPIAVFNSRFWRRAS